MARDDHPPSGQDDELGQQLATLLADPGFDAMPRWVDDVMFDVVSRPAGRPKRLEVRGLPPGSAHPRPYDLDAVDPDTGDVVMRCRFDPARRLLRGSITIDCDAAVLRACLDIELTSPVAPDGSFEVRHVPRSPVQLGVDDAASTRWIVL